MDITLVQLHTLYIQNFEILKISFCASVMSP